MSLPVRAILCTFLCAAWFATAVSGQTGTPRPGIVVVDPPGPVAGSGALPLEGVLSALETNPRGPAVLQCPEEAQVGIPAVAVLDGISIADFAKSGVVRVYPADGVQAFDAISATQKRIQILLFASKPGHYVLVVAAVESGSLVFLESPFRVALQPAAAAPAPMAEPSEGPP